MRRRLFTLATTVCASLLVIVASIWAWSFFRFEEVVYRSRSGYVSAAVDCGRVVTAWINRPADDESLPWLVKPGSKWSHEGSADVIRAKRVTDEGLAGFAEGWSWRFLGVWRGRMPVARREAVVFTSPLWIAVVVLAALPAWAAYPRVRAAVKTSGGARPAEGDYTANCPFRVASAVSLVLCVGVLWLRIRSYQNEERFHLFTWSGRCTTPTN